MYMPMTYSRTSFERPPLLQAESGRSRQVAAHRRPRFKKKKVLETCQWWPDKVSGVLIFIPQTCFCTQNDQLAMLCLTVLVVVVGCVSQTRP